MDMVLGVIFGICVCAAIYAFSSKIGRFRRHWSDDPGYDSY